MGAVKAHAFKDRAAVMGQLQDVSGNGCRILGDDQQGLFYGIFYKRY